MVSIYTVFCEDGEKVYQIGLLRKGADSPEFFGALFDTRAGAEEALALVMELFR